MDKRKFIAFITVLILIVSHMNVFAEETVIFDEGNPADRNEREMSVEEVRLEIAEEAALVEKLEEGKDYAENQAYCEAESLTEAQEIAEQYDAELISYEEGIAVFDTGRDISEILSEEAESQSPNARIYPDYYMEIESINDPDYSKQWFHNYVKDNSVWGNTNGSGAIVAVVDTGIDTDHPDLAGNIRGAVKTGNATSEVDKNGHGTHVAGIIASIKSNKKGGCGVAPGAEIYSVCVGNPKSEKEGITVSAMVSGIKKAVNAGANVVNLSLGLDTTPAASTISNMQEVMDYAYENGVTVVASAGNNSSAAEHYPACLDHVISVAACTKNGGLAYYSNYGEWVDIVAPGSTIYSTYPDDAYKYLSGTSMASPVVAGAAALIYASNEELRNRGDSSAVDEVTSIILAATDGKSYCYNSNSRSVDGGCIDFTKVVEEAEEEEIEDHEDMDIQDNVSDNHIAKLTLANGGELTYKSRVEFKGNKIKASSLNVSISYNGRNYSLKSAKIKNGKHAGTATVVIKKLENADKSVNAVFKGLTFSVEIAAKTVSHNNLKYTQKKDGSLSRVMVYVEGKDRRVKKSMYTYDANNKQIIFSGDYEGTVVIDM